MMTLLRRFWVLAALMFWQGGFTFYAAVVVPIGQEVLGSHKEQGFITREVTVWLNVAGMAALLIFLWDIFTSKREPRRQKLLRWLSWGLMVLATIILLWLHHYLDSQLDDYAHGFVDRRAFGRGHRVYLWVSTGQWVCSLAYAVLSLLAWRSEDRPNLDSQEVKI